MKKRPGAPNRAELIAIIETQQQIIAELRAEIKRLKERRRVRASGHGAGRGTACL